MTLEQLRIFVAVAERLHMTQAAEALHVTQSAVSAAIAALERHHATRLFDRVGRGIALSEAGRVFLPEARAVLDRAEAAALALDDLAGLRRGVLTIAASQTVASYWLPARMARFAQAYPAVTLRLAIGNTAQVADAVTAGAAELGFVEGEVDAPALAEMQVGTDRLALFAARHHPLADAPIDRRALLAADWVLREPGSGTRSQFELAMAAMEIAIGDLRIRLELPSNEAVLGAAEAGGLIAPVSELAAGPLGETGRLQRLALDLPERAFALLTHQERHRSRAAAAFIAQL